MLGASGIWVVLGGVALGVGVSRAASLLSETRVGAPAWAVVLAQVGFTVWGASASGTAAMGWVSALLSAALLTLGLVDGATLRLPDVATLPLIVCGLAVAALGGETLQTRAAAAAAGYGGLAGLAYAFRRLRGREGVGMGDAKLLGAAGAWLGWRALPWMILLACALAFTWVGVRAIREGRGSLTHPLPFGPPLAAAFWIVWLYGAPAP